jgi:hypothetical protein
MITFKNLFVKFYPDLIRQANEENFATGYITAQIVKRLIEEEGISVPLSLVEQLSGVSENCKSEEDRIENWEKVFRTIKLFSGVGIETSVAKALSRNHSMTIQNFSYRLFGIVVYIKDQENDPASKAKGRLPNNLLENVANFERLNEANGLKDCEQIFEKVAFLLSSALEIRPFQVILRDSSLLHERFGPAQRVPHQWRRNRRILEDKKVHHVD